MRIDYKIYMNRLHGKLYRQSKNLSRRGLYEFLDCQCSRLGTALSVLNVGSGGDVEGCLKLYAERYKWNLISLDIDSVRDPDIIGSIENVNLPDQTFDVIFMIEVLEHVGDTSAAILNLHRMLSPNGKLILSVPFMLPIHDAPHDFYRFTEFGLRRVFSMFSQLQIEPRNGFFESCVVLAVRSLATSNGSKGAVLLIAGMCIYMLSPVARFVDRKIPIRESTTGYTIVCRR